MGKTRVVGWVERSETQQSAREGERSVTAEQLLALGSQAPCELIDGSIVYKTPTEGVHGIVEVNLVRRLSNFVSERKLGLLFGGEVGIVTGRSPDRIRAADITLISHEKMPEGPPEAFIEVAPDLVVEIVSPNDRWQDVREKLEEYFSLGVPLVWLVEPKRRAVLVFRSLTEVVDLSRQDVLLGEGILEGFEVPVRDLFPG